MSPIKRGSFCSQYEKGLCGRFGLISGHELVAAVLEAFAAKSQSKYIHTGQNFSMKIHKVV